VGRTSMPGSARWSYELDFNKCYNPRRLFGALQLSIRRGQPASACHTRARWSHYMHYPTSAAGEKAR